MICYVRYSSQSKPCLNGKSLQLSTWIPSAAHWQFDAWRDPVRRSYSETLATPFMVSLSPEVQHLAPGNQSPSICPAPQPVRADRDSWRTSTGKCVRSIWTQAFDRECGSVKKGPRDWLTLYGTAAEQIKRILLPPKNMKSIYWKYLFWKCYEIMLYKLTIFKATNLYKE